MPGALVPVVNPAEILPSAMLAGAKPEDDVGEPSLSYKEMAERWDLLHDLLGGTKTMRDRKEKWLPRAEAESWDKYERRLRSSFLYPGLEDAVENLAGKPFCKPVTVQGELPESLAVMKRDATTTGVDLTQFSRALFRAVWKYGVGHILVDHTIVAPGATLGDEIRAGARPFFVNVEAPDLIGWRTFIDDTGREQLLEIRLRERVIVPHGRYGDREVERVRVYGIDAWELWEKNDKEKYDLIHTSSHTFGAVPLVTVYFDKTGFLTAKPPLEKLAWINLAHWQSSSEQRNILRVARIAILFAAGFSDGELTDLVVGANRFVKTGNPSGRLEYVEHTGSAIGAGNADLDKLEAWMDKLGSEPFVSRSGNVTATSQAIEEGRSQSDMQVAIRALEQALREAYVLAAKWRKVELPSDFAIDVFNDFGFAVRAQGDLQLLLSMRQGGELSRLTFLREVKRRGVLGEMLDVEDEASRVEEEALPTFEEQGAEGSSSDAA